MAEAQNKRKNSKLVYKLESPFTAPKWPNLDHSIESALVEMLLSLLEPIGIHKRNHTTPSKGKRSKKRKRKQAAQQRNDEQDQTPKHKPTSPPPPPEIHKHITLGFNSTARHLEAAIQHRADVPNTTEPCTNSALIETPLDLIFVTHPPASPLNAHLPALCALASRPQSSTDPSLRPTLLIPLPVSAEPRLAAALAVPRVSILAIKASARDAGVGATPLMEFCRDRVPPVDVPWLREAAGAVWMGTRVGIEGE